ncbi:Glucose-6-phosphate 1-dehydrogenase [Planctomycetes bacterium Poly30]|uniref:Glucose-6-phosphate 1-dehydrogenase n=1 Tax=Saltatorellus ferox TaxID=2528018 RepID=A0A518EYE8_9BACT|nr:Glucose-6-phosphate 1-dehydrogenase [Planctomycetes bacterium Poly30]
MQPKKATPPSTLVIFGGTGDLARRKLLPALAELTAAGSISPKTRIVGVATSPENTEASYRQLVAKSLVEADVPPEVAKALCQDCVHYQGLGDGSTAAYQALGERLLALEAEHDLPPRRAFYLALPTAALGKAVQGLTAAGLNADHSGGWTRVVLEKPFGTDLASAHALIDVLRNSFREEQIFRIDHYLGKETVQNLLAFRFGNSIFEALWNRDRIAAVEITVAEELGLGSRAGYYDKSGALRDMIQNHLTQLLTLVAMEVPPHIDADSVRYEKAKVLRSLAPLSKSDVVFGQYARNGELLGYHEEKDVPSDSSTETFAAVRCEIMNWRWRGVPFYLRSGKRMGRRLTRIGVQFKESPVCMFENEGVCEVNRNVLTMTLQPDPGFSLYMNVKEPGSGIMLDQFPLTFRHDEHFDDLPDAYETLLLDILRGDQTLFVHSDEVLRSWDVFDPVLTMNHTIHPYEAGTWGPQAANVFGIADQALMRDH